MDIYYTIQNTEIRARRSFAKVSYCLQEEFYGGRKDVSWLFRQFKFPFIYVVKNLEKSLLSTF